MIKTKIKNILGSIDWSRLLAMLVVQTIILLSVNLGLIEYKNLVIGLLVCAIFVDHVHDKA